MKFISTRGKSTAVHASEAILAGLAPDGGLYVPETFPRWDGKSTDAATILAPFFESDAIAGDLPEICANAFNFEIPVKSVNATDGSSFSVLELFHGPTAAFKDVGARFLAECMIRLKLGKAKTDQAAPLMTVMVATSGDTGGAVAAAFYNKPNTRVIILFPKGMVSARQMKQLTCWGGNVDAYAVLGTFDDCQRMVKEAFQDSRFYSRGLTSANSINIGRLLPQMTYYAKASVDYSRSTGRHPNFIIPSGNMGNAVAAFWAKKMGFPIGRIVLSTNANRAIGDYLHHGVHTHHSTIATLANAMDVGNPSNLERAINLYPVIDEFRKDAESIAVSDSEISATIQKWAKQGEVFCPHTATAVHAWEKIRATQPSAASHTSPPIPSDWIIVATAHPAKFETIVEPLVGHTLEVPPTIAAIMDQESIYREIDPTLDQIY
jgi:threonine synthase